MNTLIIGKWDTPHHTTWRAFVFSLADIAKGVGGTLAFDGSERVVIRLPLQGARDAGLRAFEAVTERGDVPYFEWEENPERARRVDGSRSAPQRPDDLTPDGVVWLLDEAQKMELLTPQSRAAASLWAVVTIVGAAVHEPQEIVNSAHGQVAAPAVDESCAGGEEPSAVASAEDPASVEVEVTFTYEAVGGAYRVTARNGDPRSRADEEDEGVKSVRQDASLGGE